mmetsp:Transcript_4466/g.18324  ORF Transcript_4466/g.18324 Transcript_4466/m.18324 type:complete len:207 (+) Transcript_4466:839-1459(+)
MSEGLIFRALGHASNVSVSLAFWSYICLVRCSLPNLNKPRTGFATISFTSAWSWPSHSACCRCSRVGGQCGQRPEPDAPVVGPAVHALGILPRGGEHSNRVIVTFELPHTLECFRVPKSDSGVVGPTNQVASHHRERQHSLHVALQHANTLKRLSVPNTDSLVPGAAVKVAAVRCQYSHVILVALENAHALECVRVPYPDRVVVRS